MEDTDRENIRWPFVCIFFVCSYILYVNAAINLFACTLMSVCRTPSPELNPEERDARTVFCMQLAARIRPRDLEDFFSAVGKVNKSLAQLRWLHSLGFIS